MDPNPAVPAILSTHRRWAHLRFSVVGPLLASPPGPGELGARLRALSEQFWQHPRSGQPVRFGASTIERWYYLALRAKDDPVGVLRRRPRRDRGKFPALSEALAQRLVAQYREHPQWSYRLHADNLAAVAEKQPELGTCPAYPTVRRFLKAKGLYPQPRRGPAHSAGAQAARARFAGREVRSYQSDRANALWHLDFHHGGVRVLGEDGQWVYPVLFGALDDCTRLCCHLQWYLREGAAELCHGLSQGFLKRALPRAVLMDNGGPMIAAETVQGLARLGVVQELTLPYSPYQNGKQEAYWNQIAGRLLPMLEGVRDLTLRALNDATQAWAELEYNRKEHSELGRSPVAAYQHSADAGRPCPALEALELAFAEELVRTQRRTDGTFTLHGVRFEVPSRYGHFERLHVRAASWDLSRVHLVDPTGGEPLCRVYPLDKQRNAAGQRAARAAPLDATPVAPSGMAPLLHKLVAEYAATGLPPAYLPQHGTGEAS